MLAYNMAAGGAENVADKKDVHPEDFTWDEKGLQKVAAVLGCLGWRRANVFN